MRKMFAVIAAAALVASTSLFAAETTIKGEVVDVACQTGKAPNGQGEAHKGCATGCAKRGNQMGILAQDAVYEIHGEFAADNNAKLIEFVAAQVEATGEVSEKDGKKIITVKSMKLAK
jgi:type 1 fimbria pilin